MDLVRDAACAACLAEISAKLPMFARDVVVILSLERYKIWNPKWESLEKPPRKSQRKDGANGGRANRKSEKLLSTSD